VSAAGPRPAESRDLDALERLEEGAFETDQLDRRALRHAILSPTILALVAEGEGDDLDGYALVQVRRGSRIGRLTSVAVAKAAAGRGLGTHPHGGRRGRSGKAGCDRMRLEVRADNDRAIHLYESGGYRRIATVPEYYEDGTAALRFEKALA
jgi:ribosomal protein S18 acetylase RimI-like enzyme